MGRGDAERFKIMARIRTVKPEFWTSAQVLECSPNARLMFIGLFNFSDDCGRHPNNSKQIKAEIFPADDFSLLDVKGMIDELSSNGLITPYVVDNTEYFLINGWHHQRIDKPQPPKCPAPPEQFQEHSENDTGTIPPDTIGKDTIGKERKGKEGVKTLIPKDFALSEELIKYAKSKGIDDVKYLQDYTDGFILQCKSKGYKYADFNCTWKKWFPDHLKKNPASTVNRIKKDQFV